MDTLDIIIPPTAKVKVFENIYTLKSFTLKQSLELVKFFEGVKENINLESGLSFKVFQNLTNEQIAKLLSVILNTDIDAETSKQISLAELSEIIKAVCSINDFKKIFANFNSALEMINKSS